MKNILITSCILTSLFITSIYSDNLLHFDSSSSKTSEQNVTINFQDVSMLEFLRYVSKVAEVNFIYDEKILNFRVSLVTGKETTPLNILSITLEMLKQQGVKTEEKSGYFFLTKIGDEELEENKETKLATYSQQKKVQCVNTSLSSPLLQCEQKEKFRIQKLQYHQGSEILSAIKNIAVDLHHNPTVSSNLVKTIGSMQWMQSTNSILYSGAEEELEQLSLLISSLDVQKKQVFIEILVIETDVKNGQEFGLEWGGGGKYYNKLGYEFGNFQTHPRHHPSFGETLQEINSTNTPKGPSQFPPGKGLDLGVIGDVILHKGMSYCSLGTLVSALENEGNSTIILNQKIITQDNKLSSIFVGDNIPFTGSVIKTVGASQQTSANIEYRDVGVKLHITPLLGEEDMITLDISEEITEVVSDLIQTPNLVNGIQTTKTDMATQVHVPDQSFLVLSGMIRNTKRQHRSGIPCLGGLPLFGAAFSKTITNDEKRNVIIFVRPQIINSPKDYYQVTAVQEKQFKNESEAKQ